MSKVFGIFFLFFLLYNQIFAENDIKIISRQEWGANESYRYLDSPEWQKIVTKWDNTPKKELTPDEQEEANISAEKTKKANDFLIKNFPSLFSVSKVINTENGHKLAWPIAITSKKYAIVVHHTDIDVTDSLA